MFDYCDQTGCDYVSSCAHEVVENGIIAGLSLGGVHATNIRLHTFKWGTIGKSPLVFGTLPGLYSSSSSRGRSGTGGMPCVPIHRDIVPIGILVAAKCLAGSAASMGHKNLYSLRCFECPCQF
jgi:hypothetical protein